MRAKIFRSNVCADLSSFQLGLKQWGQFCVMREGSRSKQDKVTRHGLIFNFPIYRNIDTAASRYKILIVEQVGNDLSLDKC